MPLPILLGPLLGSTIATFLGWVFRKVIVTFLVATAIYFMIDMLTPLVLRLASSYLNTNPLTLLNGVPQSVWWFASAFKIDFGLKVMFTALATRFLIRRIPFVG